jgi:hypothetical protein
VNVFGTEGPRKHQSPRSSRRRWCSTTSRRFARLFHRSSGWTDRPPAQSTPGVTVQHTTGSAAAHPGKHKEPVHIRKPVDPNRQPKPIGLFFQRPHALADGAPSIFSWLDRSASRGHPTPGRVLRQTWRPQSCGGAINRSGPPIVSATPAPEIILQQNVREECHCLPEPETEPGRDVVNHRPHLFSCSMAAK